MIWWLVLACTSKSVVDDTASAVDDTAVVDDTAQDSGDSGDSGETTGRGMLRYEGSAVTDGVSYAGTEDRVFVDDDGEGAEVCRLRYTWTSTATREDCPDCDWAFDLVSSGAQVVTDTGPGCLAVLGVDGDNIDTLNGMTVAYGYIGEYMGHAEILLTESDGTWGPVDFASWDEATGAFSYSWDDGLISYEEK